MRSRRWWWVGLALDVILLALGIYMAFAAADIAIRNDGSPAAMGVATLFSALPIFCVLAPWAAWRARGRARPARQIMVLFAAPWIYAIFLGVFLFT